MTHRPCVYALASNTDRQLSTDLCEITTCADWSFVEFHETMADAILRKKRIKKWRRAWKLEMIERQNPQWRDLYEQAVQ